MYGYGYGQIGTEDPASILRRIRASEAENDELPTLPSPDISTSSTSNRSSTSLIHHPRARNGHHTTAGDASGLSMVARKAPVFNKRRSLQLAGNLQHGEDSQDSIRIQTRNQDHDGPRRVLSPVKLNTKSGNGNWNPASPGDGSLDRVTKRRAKKPVSTTRTALSSPGTTNITIAPSTASSARTAILLPPTLATKARPPRVQEISRDTSTNLDASNELGSVGHSKLDDSVRSASNSSALNDSDDLERQLQQLDDSGLVHPGQETSRPASSSSTPARPRSTAEDASSFISISDASLDNKEEGDASFTPVPASVPRFERTALPSPIDEEREAEDEQDPGALDATAQDPSVSMAAPALPSSSSSTSVSSTDDAGEADDDDGDDEPALSPAEERTAAHVVLRRRTNPHSTASTTATATGTGTNHPVVRRSAAYRTSLPSSSPTASSPASAVGSDRTGTPYSTPGIGRRLSGPQAEGSIGNESDYTGLGGGTADHTDSPSSRAHTTVSSTPYTTGATSASSKLSPAYPDSMTTPRAAGGDADLERRKNHLLSTLRLTALKSSRQTSRYLKRGTPFPSRLAGPGVQERRARSMTPAALGEDSELHDSSLRGGNANGAEAKAASRAEEEEEGGGGAEQEEDMTGTSSLTSASSQDLTTHPRKGLSNTSLPLAGVGVGAETLVSARFDGAKLNGYLHTLNTHLSKENQNLVRTLEETQAEMGRLRRRFKGKRSGDTSGFGDDGEEEGDADVTREMLQNHQETREDIRQIRRQLGEDGQEGDRTMREEEMQRELSGYRTQLGDKDDEIAALREQVLALQRAATGDVSTDQSGEAAASSLQARVFALQDELASVRVEHSSQSTELTRLRQELLDSSARSNELVAGLQARTDELMQELEEKDAALEGQEDAFQNKMKNLEEELCKVMEEQEELLRQTRRENEDMKADHERQKTAMEERSEQSRDEVTRLAADKEKLQKLLDEVASSKGSKGNDADKKLSQERVNLLQAEVEELQGSLRTSRSELQTKEAKLATLQTERDRLSSDMSAAQQAEQRKDAQLKDAQAMLEESEANLRNTENQVNRLKITLEEAQATISRLHQENANTSIAIDNDLQKKLDTATREIGNLKHQLANSAALHSNSRNSSPDAKELEIRTLKSSNHELETRVNQLRRQAIANSMLSLATPVKGGAGPGGITPDKSVRFDSVKSMRTPKNFSQVLANMSSFDRTSPDANQTVAPLYTEIDNLQDQVKQLRDLLTSANDDVDDKLRKLDRAGMSTIQLAERLEAANAKIRELQVVAKKNRTEVGGGEKVYKELKGVREQLSTEKKALLNELGDIKQHCNQISSQLESSRAAQTQALRELQSQKNETRRLRQHLESSQGAYAQLDGQQKALIEERNSILQGVASLQSDLFRVQKDAACLGEDLRLVKQTDILRQPFGAITCSKSACLEAHTLHRQQAKGLLVQIQYLKACFTKESWFRADLSQQKIYLQSDIRKKQRIIDSTNASLARFGMPSSEHSKSNKRSLKSVASAVLFTARMKRLTAEWAKQSAVRSAIKDAYKQTRGKPLLA